MSPIPGNTYAERANGERSPAKLVESGKQEFTTIPQARLDYLEIVDPESLDPESLEWDPLDGDLRRLLDSKAYVSLSRERGSSGDKAVSDGESSKYRRKGIKSDSLPFPLPAEAGAAVARLMEREPAFRLSRQLVGVDCAPALAAALSAALRGTGIPD